MSLNSLKHRNAVWTRKNHQMAIPGDGRDAPLENSSLHENFHWNVAVETLFCQTSERFQYFPDGGTVAARMRHFIRFSYSYGQTGSGKTIRIEFLCEWKHKSNPDNAFLITLIQLFSLQSMKTRSQLNAAFITNNYSLWKITN